MDETDLQIESALTKRKDNITSELIGAHVKNFDTVQFLINEIFFEENKWNSELAEFVERKN